MRRELNRLSAVAVNAITKPGRHADGGNLYLSVSNNGGRRWVFLYRRNGKPTEMGLGSVKSISLKQARELAAQARSQLAMGIDPLSEKRKARAVVPSFGECALDYIETNKSEWRNDKHIAQWRSTLETYCVSLWNLPVDQIDTEAVLSVLKPLWRTKQETASRLRGRMERVLAAATVRSHRSGVNPAQWKNHLEYQLPKRQKLARGHHAALPFADMAQFMADLQLQGGAASRALELTILCAVRTGEMIGANRSEFDLDNRLWVIPPRRMKAGREHRVPLSGQALELVTKLQALSSSSNYLFEGAQADKPLSNMAMASVLKRMKVPVTVHGFRSTFRDWVAECTNYQGEIAEAALAHTIKNATEAAYRRGDLLEKRRELMQAWADYCNGMTGADQGRITRRHNV